MKYIAINATYYKPHIYDLDKLLAYTLDGLTRFNLSSDLKKPAVLKDMINDNWRVFVPYTTLAASLYKLDLTGVSAAYE